MSDKDTIEQKETPIWFISMTDKDTISRQAALDCVTYDVEYTIECIEKLPSTQPHLIAKIKNGIKATNSDDVYSCGMRNGMRWCMSLIDGKEPLYENCPSVQPENCTELKQEFLRMASYIDVLLECSDEQKETLMEFISRLAEFMPWTKRD